MWTSYFGNDSCRIPTAPRLKEEDLKSHCVLWKEEPVKTGEEDPGSRGEDGRRLPHFLPVNTLGLIIRLQAQPTSYVTLSIHSTWQSNNSKWRRVSERWRCKLICEMLTRRNSSGDDGKSNLKDECSCSNSVCLLASSRGEGPWTHLVVKSTLLVCVCVENQPGSSEMPRLLQNTSECPLKLTRLSGQSVATASGRSPAHQMLLPAAALQGTAPHAKTSPQSVKGRLRVPLPWRHQQPLLTSAVLGPQPRKKTSVRPAIGVSGDQFKHAARDLLRRCRYLQKYILSHATCNCSTCCCVFICQQFQKCGEAVHPCRHTA